MSLKLAASFSGLLALAELAATTPITTNLVSDWMQCGGIGYTGATACVPGCTCEVYNPYFSFCLQPGQTEGVIPTSTSTSSTSTTALPTDTSKAGLASIVAK